MFLSSLKAFPSPVFAYQRCVTFVVVYVLALACTPKIFGREQSSCGVDGCRLVVSAFLSAITLDNLIVTYPNLLLPSLRRYKMIGYLKRNQQTFYAMSTRFCFISSIQHTQLSSHTVLMFFRNSAIS